MCIRYSSTSRNLKKQFNFRRIDLLKARYGGTSRTAERKPPIRRVFGSAPLHLLQRRSKMHPPMVRTAIGPAENPKRTPDHTKSVHLLRKTATRNTNDQVEFGAPKLKQLSLPRRTTIPRFPNRNMTVVTFKFRL